MPPSILSKTYEVRLDNGIEIDFDKNGAWDKVDGNYISIPAELIPEFIVQYVKANFPDTRILKIDKERGGYEVELSNKLDLKFNSRGKLLCIDD